MTTGELKPLISDGMSCNGGKMDGLNDMLLNIFCELQHHSIMSLVMEFRAMRENSMILGLTDQTFLYW
jgi:hypothetical protein